MVEVYVKDSLFLCVCVWGGGGGRSRLKGGWGWERGKIQQKRMDEYGNIGYRCFNSNFDWRSLEVWMDHQFRTTKHMVRTTMIFGMVDDIKLKFNPWYVFIPLFHVKYTYQLTWKRSKLWRKLVCYFCPAARCQKSIGIRLSRLLTNAVNKAAFFIPISL